ncbi:MAG TPA: M1 family metallopeptidase, partial [Burkholderiaceae bacterium]
MKLFPFAAALALAACLAGPAAAAAAGHRVVLPGGVVPAAYRIDFTPHADAGDFDATVEIDLDVRAATDRIVLNAADLVISHATLSGEAAAPRVTMDAAAERATFAFDHPVAPGPHVLAIAYHGRIFDQPRGLFRLRYATPRGERTELFTQFEETDARRFVPCWDEPAIKARFELSARVPAGLMAVGNMPVAATEPLPGGLQRVRFAPTPRMSSYLLFFGLGDFERVHREVDGVDVGVIVKRGDTARAAFALDAATRLLPYYDAWFGTRYPLPKLDMVAGAGESIGFGAMENWGALFYFERDLLVDERLATEHAREVVFLTVAHEMAHQWFGDLVTMDWWDDLWLNEGFATWMEDKATGHFHPEWQPWLQAAEPRQRAMDTDAREGTHPVVARIDDITQAAGLFDDITYQKGAQVIRTLEAYVGEDAFRDGVRRYLAAHAYGNTVTEDLWAALDQGSDHPVATIARDLTRQAGVPLVKELGARCRGDHTELTLSQGRYATDADAAAATRWHVPVI